MTKRLIVTHHAPDCDAIGSTWMLKRFDAQHYATAQVAFVDPGTTIDPSEAERLGFQMHEVTHVDTGLGEFDHHQADRGLQRICATSLVYDYVCRMHPELKSDAALQELVKYVTDDDHFGEVDWPEPEHPRYSFMLSSMLHGFESVDPHNDESQMHFGFTCFDCAYASLRENLQAREVVAEAGQPFEIGNLKCLAVETKNDSVMKFAQKSGFMLVIRKDPTSGEVRVKARPDAPVDLRPLADAIAKLDNVGTWYYHPSGKMLLNGSRKHRHQRPTKLSLQEVVAAAKTSLA